MSSKIDRTIMGLLSGSALVLGGFASCIAFDSGAAAAGEPFGQAAAPAPIDAALAQRCAALAKSAVSPGTVIDSTSIVAGGAKITGATAFPGFGQPLVAPRTFCRVVGRISSEPDSNVNVEVWLPAADWDGRLHGAGNGGFAGTINFGQMSAAIAAGQASVSTDTGHQGSAEDASWAKGHPARVRDYAYRAIHVSTLAAKQLISAFYGRKPDRSLFVSCSNGGRQALIEAGRFPDDYDGIIAGAPASSFTDLTVTMVSSYRAQTLPGAALTAAQAAVLQQRVIEDCDAADGIKDGLVSDPRQCHVDIQKLSCSQTAAAACFSPPQIHALEAIYAGPRDGAGRSIGAGGFMPSGAEAGFLGWGSWLFIGQPGGKSQSVAYPRGIFGNFAAKPIASVEDYDFDRDPARVKAAVGGLLDAGTNLGRFFDRGGKLAMYHGWGDPAIPPGLTLRYYKRMMAQSGPKARASSVLFMVPGMKHCFDGPGPADFGQLTAPLPGATPRRSLVGLVQTWLDTGRRPTEVIGRSGGIPGAPPPPDASRRERLLCAEPTRARLKPGGNPEVADDYRCVAGWRSV